MTITQDPSSPLVAVVGATGRQGGSVIEALAESDRAYRIRGFTRDSTKAAARALAERGIDILVVDLVVKNKEQVFNAFKGVDYAFLVTNFWEHGDMEKEATEGILLVDAAKAGGAKGIVWSGLAEISKVTGGKYTHVYHFEGKARVTAHGRASGVPFADVQTGMYASNFLEPLMKPQKQADGSFVIAWPLSPAWRMPIIDIVKDYGLFVRRVIEAPVFPDGAEVITHGEVISLKDFAAQLSAGTGKTIKYEQVSPAEFEVSLQAAGFPPHMVEDLLENYLFYEEFGWSVKDTTLDGLARRPRTWAEFVKDTDWSSVLT